MAVVKAAVGGLNRSGGPGAVRSPLDAVQTGLMFPGRPGAGLAGPDTTRQAGRRARLGLRPDRSNRPTACKCLSGLMFFMACRRGGVLTDRLCPEIMHIILGVCVKKIRAGVNFHKSVPRFFINLYLALTKETANLSEPSPQKLPVP